MSLRILVDMNLSPLWVMVFCQHGWEAVHWTAIGDPRATDRTIMDWALAHDHIVFTHDLDFGTLLALSEGKGPSVVQVRGQNVLPEHLEPVVCSAILQHKSDLESGALVVVDEIRSRVRVLPIR